MTTPRLFEQMLEDNAGKVPPDISPNQQICGEVIFEPLGAGVRVTGRNETHQLLWGLVCSKGMLEQPHGSIAIYSALREAVEKALVSEGLPVSESRDSVDDALAAITKAEKFLKAAKKNITVKKVSPETRSRAAVIAKAVTDAFQMVTLEVPFVGTRGDEEEAEESK
jgi:hypothetical protein